MHARGASPVRVRGRFRLYQAFADAFRGLKTLVATEANARIHLAASILVLAAGGLLGIPAADWCWLVVAIAMVWTAEAFNTALEFLADEVAEEHRERIGRAKDLAAGAVFIAALAAATIGLLVLGPRMLAWLE